jgi:CRISPR-associated protein Cas2
MQNADVHIKRVKKILPEKGHIGIMTITDKQFGMMEIYYGKKLAEPQNIPQQLELF